MTLPNLQGALKDGFGKAVVVCDMPQDHWQWQNPRRQYFRWNHIEDKDPRGRGGGVRNREDYFRLASLRWKRSWLACKSRDCYRVEYHRGLEDDLRSTDHCREDAFWGLRGHCEKLNVTEKIKEERRSLDIRLLGKNFFFFLNLWEQEKIVGKLITTWDNWITDRPRQNKSDFRQESEHWKGSVSRYYQITDKIAN